MSAHANIAINIEDMVAKVPKTILYNMGDSLHLYLDRAQWRWESNCLKVRIPMSLNSNSFLCGIKYYDKPDETLVYISQFIHDRGSTNLNFSGMQVWIDLQDWNVYGLQYKNDSVVAYSDPIQLADPGWEQCALESGAFGFNERGKIIVKNNNKNGNNEENGGAQLMTTPRDQRCYGENNFWDNLGGFFGGIGDWFGETGTGIGTWLNDNLFPAIKALLHPGIGGGSKGNPDGNGPGGNYGPGGDYPGDGSFPGGGSGDGGGSGGTGGGYYNPGGGTNDPNDTANTDPPIHGGGTHIPFPGGTQINPVPTPFPVFEQPDSNGFYPSRIAALEVYLQINPNGMLDCAQLNSNPNFWNLWQEIGGYQIPQSVIQRMDDIRNANAPVYTYDNFHIQSLYDAYSATINCDYFSTHITQLPKNLNGVTMTPIEFLEYFRTHISDFSGNIAFEPYYHYVAGSVNINETTKFNSPYQASLGALVHIEIPVDEGSVIESDYTSSTGSNGRWYFKFTTITAPIDYEHPISGNREFGIFPDNVNGGYNFYISGVDRITDVTSTLINFLSGGYAFDQADNLWHSIHNTKERISIIMEEVQLLMRLILNMFVRILMGLFIIF